MSFRPGSRGGSRGGFGGGRGGFGGGRGGSRGGFGGRGGGRGGSRGGFGGRGGGRGGSRGGFGDRGGRGGARGGRGGARGGAAGGSRGGAKVVLEPHKHAGVFIARGKEDLLVTKNMAPGESVYGEKRISVEEPSKEDGVPPTKVEYRVWNPFRSKLAAGIMGGLDELFIAPGKKVLYLGAASGTSVSHVSDVVGPEGVVYAVEFSHRPGRELISMAKKRPNVIPIIEDARHPQKYRMLVGMVDCVFADVAQPDQARIIALNSHMFLKDQGGVVISIKANCIDSTVDAETVFAREVQKLREEKIKPLEQLTLEPYERDHCIVVGRYMRSGLKK
ncbi:rRNA methyltransferase NOP1 KNAG_0K01645 [Huiozyma naganishii CBS 8797]|uniref:rRNA 2'-O-methyltransferase fibrillarin n=1 Tax=Huiozyma naganishii (strain ATCC MYA-139 / BCRC 22969 / CBS 8797 / KCTC 17520 / NBRC 10181 / NCYC 3082 / Yp74L-3) TaxID=1071383 RepID=J7S3C8_HUIN7|nr:hypothetical protein KNAG_0K01645 [Kazachstania naganishii CBS 8797]CCK72527.1 hypothetical protein KNAG_0K01645 [Kazachstania naganishii CBS 8797]